MEKDSDLALQAWVMAHLDITQTELTLEQARRWQRLRMRNFQTYCRIALFGFVERRRRDGLPDAWPQAEFKDFIGEFGCKLDLVLQRRIANVSLCLFDRVGRRTLLSAMPNAADAIKTPAHLRVIGRFGALIW